MRSLKKGLYRHWEKAACIAGVLLFLLLASTLSLERYWSFSQPLGLDNAYFFQRTWQAAFLEEPARTLLNTELGQGLIAGRHFEPVLLLTVPGVRLNPRMESLLLFQVLLIGLGGFAAYGLGRLSTRDGFAALMLMGAWLCQPGLWEMATTDFRTMALAAPFVAGAWWAWVSGRWRWALCFSFLAMACREEVVWLLLAGLPFVLLLQEPERRIKAGGLYLGATVLWLLVLHQFHAAPNDFISVAEMPGAALGALQELSLFAPVGESSSGGALSQLQASTGGSFWLLPFAPIAALPVGMTWLGKAMNPEVAGPWAHHLWAVALGTMALVTAAAVGRIGAWVSEIRSAEWGRRSMRAIAAALFLVQAQHIQARFGSNLVQAPSVLSGARAPHLRVGTPWEAMGHLPKDEPVLTEALYVAQVAARPFVYAADDFRDEAGRKKVLSAVEWVLLRQTHEWVGHLEGEGFRPYAQGGLVRLYYREGAPGSELNPILPK